ncbi:hypothetical protein TNIN_235071 [Trichonephila inaurata madagascariensis]|uniref:Uncharacterized protein n=1 Tax=Trichonephila inaurata madagascariensis TaxID=2747483 RepID=A0A8X6ICW1_9ARAC|nr:hypothetical protein TNIN_235071 [Trichonephila inaurata madagascariensis]
MPRLLTKFLGFVQSVGQLGCGSVIAECKRTPTSLHDNILRIFSEATLSQHHSSKTWSTYEQILIQSNRESELKRNEYCDEKLNIAKTPLKENITKLHAFARCPMTFNEREIEKKLKKMDLQSRIDELKQISFQLEKATPIQVAKFEELRNYEICLEEREIWK